MNQPVQAAQPAQPIDMVFYAPATEKYPHPQLIDRVAVRSDGIHIGLYGGKTQSEITQQHQSVLVCTSAEYRQLEDSSYVTQPQQISEEAYTSALECLPPMKWGRWMGVESFRMSEFYCGNITSIYARLGDTFWTFRDNAFMSGEAIAAKVATANKHLTEGTGN